KIAVSCPSNIKFPFEGDEVRMKAVDLVSGRSVLTDTVFPLEREFYVGRTRNSDLVDRENDALSVRHFSVMAARDSAGHLIFQVTDSGSRNGTIVQWDGTVEKGLEMPVFLQEPESDEAEYPDWMDDDIEEWEGHTPDPGDTPTGVGVFAAQGNGEAKVHTTGAEDILGADDLTRYARMPRTNADDLIEYIRKTGLTKQASVIRQALRGEILFQDKLEKFEEKMLLLEVSTQAIQKTEMLFKKAGKGVYSVQEILSMTGRSNREDVMVGLARMLAEIQIAAYTEKKRTEVENKPLWEGMLSYRKALEEDRFYIAVDGEGAPAGFCQVRLNGAEMRWDLKTLAVSPEHQESGYGALLMDSMFEMIVWSREYGEGIRKVHILSALEGKVYNFYDSYLEKRKDLPSDADRFWRLESEKLVSSYEVSIVQMSDNELEMYGAILKDNDRHSQRLLRHSRAFYKKMDSISKGTPIDVVIDLSLIPERDMQKNMEVWACLVLLCRDMENVNFILEGEPVWAREHDLSETLTSQMDNAPDPEKALQALMSEIYRKALFFGVEGGLDELALERVKTSRTLVAPGEEATVEIPIISKELLEWGRGKGITIGVNQYPVVLEGYTAESGLKVALRNFEGALAIGLAKASMVLAKRRDFREKDESDNELPVLQEKILKSMQGIYSLFRDDVDLTMDDLDDMIDSSQAVRMNLAISLFLPPVVRMVVEKLHDLHDGIQLLLQAA
ncbi:MAG: GNAT family N-acetyltransferase, partial [Candidatus Tantalella remota]|nr:GNAT family N-acetyltransferase [Candidatus Tantalella remota]